ncbi:GDP fucose protein O fucosyltransferase 1 [Trichuris trichiura]|uniref:GDP-fucose protein O-fucosyltransferase 1 n=1 Tax=Trichuris trichiura TaxID=36087 RepID=A0A077YYB5_TRITR|nr:GDP fucose protein O fucosyltransferase 1 [Trichuris trichiura]
MDSNVYKYSRLLDEPSGSTSIDSSLHIQQKVIAEQDENLEKIGTNVRVLKNMSENISSELEEHAIMLDDLQQGLEDTHAKMDTVMKKVNKVLNLSTGNLLVETSKRMFTHVIFLFIFRFSLVFVMIGMFLLISLLVVIVHDSKAFDVDPNGYILYCPCMGRFGNQAEHFLGSLAFAKAINRTLALPHWVDFQTRLPSKTPFDRFFLVDPLLKYHRVILMSDFMKYIAPKIWPPKLRIGFCYGMPNDVEKECKMKQGEPSTSFWNEFGINFVGSEFFNFQGLSTDILDIHSQFAWRDIYPPDVFPVLAFKGAPAHFPVSKEHESLQRYLRWSIEIRQQCTDFIRQELMDRPFLGIHLRNNLDWPNVCVDLTPKWHIFDSRQCLGDNFEHSLMTKEICMPSKATILRQVRETMFRTGLRVLFVASEYDHMIGEFKQSLKDLPGGVVIKRRDPDDAQISLCILAKASLYIGNCISTFSTFARRERDVYGLPTEFWAMNYTSDPLRKEL